MTPPTATVEGADLDAYWSAVAAADERAALAAARAPLDRGVPLADLLDDLVVAAQRRVGELWASNAWPVAREHAATAVSEAVVRRLGESVPTVTTGPVVTVGCVAREWHALPAMVVALTLRAHGFRVTYLGASPSRELLVSAILDTGPRAVLLSASLGSSLPRARRQIEAVRGTGTPVVLGGRAFDPGGVRALQLGATAYAASPQQAVGLLPTLPVLAAPAAPLRHPGALEARSIEAEGDVISRDVLATTVATLGLDHDATPGAPGHWRGVLNGSVPHVVDCLAGALLTEDADVYAEHRAWLDGVLAHRGAPRAALVVLEDALAQRLHDHPEAVRLLRGETGPSES